MNLQYANFFFSSKSSVVELDLLEIFHPSFSMTHYIVRNAAQGVTVTLEDGVTRQFFTFYPVGLKLTGADTDLDQVMEINFGDLGQILPRELDLVNKASNFGTKPIVKYRVYRSDSLNAPINGPIVFQIQQITSNRTGSSLHVTAPKLNLLGTGERYDLNRFPMLRGMS